MGSGLKLGKTTSELKSGSGCFEAILSCKQPIVHLPPYKQNKTTTKQTTTTTTIRKERNVTSSGRLAARSGWNKRDNKMAPEKTHYLTCKKPQTVNGIISSTKPMSFENLFRIRPKEVRQKNNGWKTSPGGQKEKEDTHSSFYRDVISGKALWVLFLTNSPR